MLLSLVCWDKCFLALRFGQTLKVELVLGWPSSTIYVTNTPTSVGNNIYGSEQSLVYPQLVH